ncbi:hypothetical protein KJ603_00760 [Patescibacteria group bacterium]|nr:hypothetical protein [Patescibacteria group bacterium]
MKKFGPNAQAIILYRQIKKLQKELFEGLKKQGVFIKFEKDMLALLKKEKINQETFRVLKMFMGKERPMNATGQMELMMDRTIGKYIQVNKRLRENYILLTLTTEGDLYREPKIQYCYPMRGEGMRLKILRAMIGYSTYRQTRDIMSDVSSKSAESFRDAIGSLNRKARFALKLPAGTNNNLILSKSHSGYMINPLYPITQD